MTSFKFPPPPPPPPKASISGDIQSTYGNQRGGYSRGRGGIGGRSHGSGASGNGRGNARGGHVQREIVSSTLPRRDPSRGTQQHQLGRGGRSSENNGNNPFAHQYQRPASRTQLVPLVPSTPSNAYGNPTLSSPALTGVQVPQIDPNTLVQAMSFINTPVGMQSLAAFANHMANVGTGPQYPEPHISEPGPPQMHNSPPSVSSKKRKREERQIQFEAQKQQDAHNAQQPSKKPPRVKCKAAPEVPSFGFTLPTTPISRTSAPSKPNLSLPQKKHKVNLGFAQREGNDESNDEEDIDEETAFAAKCKVEGIVFEHNGENISLQTQAEVAAWIKDRRSQFPTRKRIAQKAQEAAVRRANELEFLQKVRGKSAKANNVDQQAQVSQAAQVKNAAVVKPKADLAEMRKKVQDSMKKMKKDSSSALQIKPKTLDLGLGYASDTASNSNDSSELSDSSAVSSLLGSSSDSDSDSGADDSDGPPEKKSTNVPTVPIKVPPPPSTPVLPQPKLQKIDVCPNWKRNGKCKYSRHCRYPHPRENEAKPMGLYERMVEQELEKADQLALDAIKFLGRNGYLG
jgi:hypothetical protein